MLRLPSTGDLDWLAPRFTPHLLHSELTVGGRTIRFPKIATGAVREPNDWLQYKHFTAPVHEPATVAWLFSLGRAIEAEHVAFFDIGAAYGYFSLLANLAFLRAKIFAVEPNPFLAGYLVQLARHNNLANFQVINRLVSDRIGRTQLKARNFVFLPEDSAVPTGFADASITVTTLERLLYKAGGLRPVLKIDVEGWQARILPKAANELVKRRSVILLECDKPEKIGRFKATNSDLARIFLRSGYRLFLTNHRTVEFKVKEITQVSEELESDLMLAMIPPDLSIVA